MKPTDFIPEPQTLGQAATEMQKDHEIQLAREECYQAATNAMELHRMLKQVSENEGIEEWAAEKIASANQALTSVRQWLEQHIVTGMKQSMPIVDIPAEPGVVDSGELDMLPQSDHDMLESDDVGEFYITKNGRAINDSNGKLIVFNSLAAANKAIEKMVSKPWNKDKSLDAVKKVKETASAGASSAGGIATGAGNLFTAKKSKLIKR